MAGQILVTGTSGAQFAVNPDLPWVAAQLRSGQLTPVQPSAAGQDQGAAESPARPSNTATKADWVAYIVATTTLGEAEAEEFTKRELIALADNR